MKGAAAGSAIVVSNPLRTADATGFSVLRVRAAQQLPARHGRGSVPAHVGQAGQRGRLVRKRELRRLRGRPPTRGN